MQSYGFPSEVWLDVGANLGQRTFQYARANPKLKVYAFEPDIEVARERMGLLSNFVVLPMAISEESGCADFFVNTLRATNSLLPFNKAGVDAWIGNVELKTESTIRVPTIRLDEFLDRMQIAFVDFLKVDAQGMDLNVIKSAGNRLADVALIAMEVAVTDDAVYKGACTKGQAIEFMHSHGFSLTETQTKSQGQEENLTFANDLYR